jgi:hypothetical protein
MNYSMGKPIVTKWKPKNPSKYIGDVNNIWARSSWERRVMNWLDLSDNVVWWSSEELIIKYLSPIDNKVHRYFPDFIVKVKTRDDKVMTYVVEVKPEYQTRPPVQKRKTKKFLQESMTYAVNEAKWKAAIEFCKDRGWQFKILTEKDLGIS